MANNEAFSRVVIDAQLADQGWNTQDTNSVRYEVALGDGTRADYVLCDRHGRSLAVIEAKRFSNNPLEVASEQARRYASGNGSAKPTRNHPDSLPQMLMLAIRS
jgi:type I restriction enzyme, R subunit